MTTPATSKAARYLTAGRVTVLEVTPRRVAALVRGSAAQPYLTAWTALTGWCCTCPAAGPCAHEAALQLIVTPRGAPTVNPNLPDRSRTAVDTPDGGAPSRPTIATIPPRLRELGRIRAGELVEGPKGKRPAALDTWRLTSPSRRLLEAAARHLGGTVRPWSPPDGTTDAFDLVTDVAELDAVVPPTEALSQAYELWSAAGCQRRCDGLTETISGRPCLCPSDTAARGAGAQAGTACWPTTRLNLILPQLPDLGVWTLTSRGYYAAAELAGLGAILDLAAAGRRMLSVRLRLDRRTVKRPGQPTRRFVVPAVETDLPLLELLDGAGASTAIAGPVPAAAALSRPTDRQTDPSGVPAPQLGAGTDPPASRPAHHDDQVESVLAIIDQAGVPSDHVQALLEQHYGVTAVEELPADQLATLHRRLLTDAGVQRLRTAAAKAAALRTAPRCVSCDTPSPDLDDAGECPTCGAPF